MVPWLAKRYRSIDVTSLEGARRLVPLGALLGAALALFGAGCRDWDRLSAERDPACISVGPSTCPEGALFCDGFESGLNPDWMDTQNNGASLRHDAVCPYHGTESLHVTTSPLDVGGSAQAALWRNQPAPAGAELYVRTFLYFKGPEPTENEINLVAHMDPRGEFSATSVSLKTRGGYLLLTNHPAMTDAVSVERIVPTDRWICLEWRMRWSTTDGTSVVWIDGAEVPAPLSPTENLEAPPPTIRTMVQLGPFNVGAPQGALEAWFDEVAISTSRIGCD